MKEIITNKEEKAMKYDTTVIADLLEVVKSVGRFRLLLVQKQMSKLKK